MIPFIKHRRIFYIISATLVGLSVVSIFVFGLNLGIDFTGGSMLSLTYQNQVPDTAKIRESLKELELAAFANPTNSDIYTREFATFVEYFARNAARSALF